MSAASPTSMAASMYRLDGQLGQSSAHGHMAALQSQYGSVSPSAQSFAVIESFGIYILLRECNS